LASLGMLSDDGGQWATEAANDDFITRVFQLRQATEILQNVDCVFQTLSKLNLPRDRGKRSPNARKTQTNVALTLDSADGEIFGAKAVPKNAGLPALPQVNLSLYMRKSPIETLAKRVGSFVAESAKRWQTTELGKTEPKPADLESVRSLCLIKSR